MQTPTSRSDTQEQLHEGMRWTVQRGRFFASLSVALLCVAAFIGGLFILAIKDVIFDLPDLARTAMLVVLLLISAGFFFVLALRPWLNERFNRSAGEQVDLAADREEQPVTLGLSLREPVDDDSLALMLLQRAESRAAEVAQSVKPGRAYPLRRLTSPGSWLALALAFWILLAIILPSHVFAIASRVIMPWSDTPPFSLTQMEPTWTPEPPDAGEDVVVSVEPAGLIPKEVDLVVLDEDGNEAERFEMAPDGEGGFSLTLKRVLEPIDFQLETRGRHTRTYTITPTPEPPVPDQPGADGSDDEHDSTSSEGSTSFDPDKVARRDLENNEGWQAMKKKLEQMLGELAEAQRLADSLDPTDADALQELADKLAGIVKQAGELGDELAEMQGELPAEASALLDALQQALTNMLSAKVPAPPGSQGGAQGEGAPTLADWLKQASDAAKGDQGRIGQGIGPSDEPSDSGTTSGTGGEGPDIVDPSTSGTYREGNTSGEEGPLPDSVMQQVPPSYRDFVSKYFENLADEQANP
ncbi:MAG: hypothetical protein AAGB26_13150 [Planctomycetota bacterium]